VENLNEQKRKSNKLSGETISSPESDYAVAKIQCHKREKENSLKNVGHD
jgi:hypothetical protein